MSFVAEGAHGAMAGDEADIVPKGEQLLADGAHQGLVVALGKIGTAYAAIEQHITNEGETFLLAEKHHMARGMAWTMDDFQGDLAH